MLGEALVKDYTIPPPTSTLGVRARGSQLRLGVGAQRPRLAFCEA